MIKYDQDIIIAIHVTRHINSESNINNAVDTGNTDRQTNK